MKEHRVWTSRLGVGVLLVGGAQYACDCAAIAQTVAPQPQPGRAATAASSGTIEEIVVTSQKRAQKLQKVPVAITAFSAKDIARTGITSASDLGQHVASLYISVSGSGAVLPFLRGVGNNTTTVGNESSVAVYLDDVYVSRLNAAFLNLSDISRIEVLKGPQGTLFGRNASAGVINIITKDPSPTFQGSASVGYSNYNTTTEKLYLSGPIAPGIAANLSVLNGWQGAGWGRDFVNSSPVGYYDPLLVKSKWIFHLSPTTTLRVAGDYSQAVSVLGSLTNTVRGTITGSPDIFSEPPYDMPSVGYKNGAPGFYDSIAGNTFVAHARSFGLSARLNQDLGFAQFSSITGYRQTAEEFKSGGEYTPVIALDYDLSSHTRTLTQELQLASKAGSPFDWIVGLFYLNEFSSYEPTEITGPGLLKDVLAFPASLPVVTPPGSFVDLFGHGRTKDYAAYTQETFHLPFHTNLTAGFRYTIDDLDGGGRTVINIPGFTGLENVTSPDVPNSVELKKATFKAGLDHQFADQILGYVSFSRGYKAGTYNLLPFTAPPTKSETLDDYEIGTKTTLLDRKLQLNAAFFYYNYTDPQVQEIENHLVFLSNAKAAQVKGFEVEGQYVVSPDLTTRFGSTYLDSHYTNFQNAPFFSPLFSPPYGAVAFAGNANGDQLPEAPKFSFNAGLNYNIVFPFGRFDFDTNYAFTGSFYFNPDNFVRQKSYGLLDASLTYQLPDNDRWSLRAFGRNITDVHYYSTDNENTGTAGFTYGAGAPAEYGVTLSYNFGR